MTASWTKARSRLTNYRCTNSSRAMFSPSPIYTPANCAPAYQLNWSVTAFTRTTLPRCDEWLDDLKAAMEADGVRILEFRAASTDVLQAFVDPRVQQQFLQLQFHNASIDLGQMIQHLGAEIDPDDLHAGPAGQETPLQFAGPAGGVQHPLASRQFESRQDQLQGRVDVRPSAAVVY
jgi:hypothetical protein